MTTEFINLDLLYDKYGKWNCCLAASAHKLPVTHFRLSFSKLYYILGLIFTFESFVFVHVLFVNTVGKMNYCHILLFLKALNYLGSPFLSWIAINITTDRTKKQTNTVTFQQISGNFSARWLGTSTSRVHFLPTPLANTLSPEASTVISILAVFIGCLHPEPRIFPEPPIK